MEIEFKHKYQSTIADLIWNAQDQKTVKFIVKTFGKHGEVVYNMILAHHFDTVMETDLAEDVLRSYK